MKTLFKNYVKDESGATLIEYGLIAALVAVAAITGMEKLGTKLSTQFENISKKLTA